MNKIFFNFSGRTEFNEQFKLAEILMKDKNYQVNFIVNDYRETLNIPDVIEKIKRSNSELYFTSKIVEGKNFSFILSLLYKMPGSLLKKVNSFLKCDSKLYFQKLSDLNSCLASYSNFIKKVSPDLLIVPEDGVGSNLCLIKAARDQNLKCLILPYEYSGFKQLLIGAKKRFRYKAEELNKNWLDAMKPYFFSEGHDYLSFFSQEELYAMIKKKVVPENIATVHGGSADKLASESKAMSEHYQKEGIKPEKIVLTGSVNDDIMANILREKSKRKNLFFKKYKLKNESPLIIFSFIPEYQGNIMFRDYNDYILTVSDALSKTNFNVVYQFHPAVQPKFRTMAIESGLLIADEPTIELISIADMYITSYSSTIRWAIAASVPVIHLDLYGFDYDDYKNCQGVVFTGTKEEFKEAVNKINDTSYFQRLISIQKTDSDKWGILDGRSSERIKLLVDNLCQ